MVQKNTYQELKTFFVEGQFCTQDIVEMTENPELIPDLMKLALSNDEPAGWRAAWALSHAMKHSINLLIPYLPEIADALPEIRKDGHIRELLKFFRDVKLEQIPESLHGQLFDYCFTLFENNNVQPGTRSNALQILLKIAEKEPLLIGEIKAAFEMISPFLSKGIRYSCQRRINEISLQTINTHKTRYNVEN
ncbi:MAG: hypothetical protein PF448_11335 [Bacteroidales bacterium]|jgi:hypothetical protein|nr:hypothetical protein [Bacteroidales bacterium]